MIIDSGYVAGFVRDDGKFYRCRGQFNPGDEVYDHRKLGVFNVTLINTLIRAAKIPPLACPIDEALYEHCLFNGGVEERRIKTLPRDRLHAPITVVTGDKIFGKQGVFIIDGHHRVVKRWRFGLRDVQAFVCPGEVAMDCRIELEVVPDEQVMGVRQVGVRRTYFDPLEPRR